MVAFLLRLWLFISSGLLMACVGYISWLLYHKKELTTKSFVSNLIFSILGIIYFIGGIVVAFVVHLDIIPIKFSLY